MSVGLMDSLLGSPTISQEAITIEARRLIEETAEDASPEKIQAKKTAFFARYFPEGQDTFAPEDAEALLEIRLSKSTLDRIHDWLVRNQNDQLTSDEQNKMKQYLISSTLLDLFHAKSRRALQSKINKTT